jgi:large subunit ribosomal protein MRP49
MLPKIKYRNPAVSVEIKRHEDPNGPATLNIFTKAQPSTPAHSVDIRSTDESEILAQLVSRTNAMELKPTEQEEAELEELKEFKARSEADRALVREKFLKERREQELLKLARGEITAAA